MKCLMEILEFLVVMISVLFFPGYKAEGFILGLTSNGHVFFCKHNGQEDTLWQSFRKHLISRMR